MNDFHETRASRQRPHRNKPHISFNWRLLTSIWTHLWHFANPILWLLSLAAIILGGFLAWTQPSGTTAQTLIRTAQNQQDPAADQQFNALPQTQQLALLARWSAPHASGNYRVFMGEANTIYFEYDPAADDWLANTVKVTDNHDGTYLAQTPDQANANATAQDATWTTTAAISKGQLLQRFRDDIANYTTRLDLSQQTSANPTAQ